MRVSEVVRCKDFPCSDARHDCYQVPDIDNCPEDVPIVLISEAAPSDLADYYYAPGDPLSGQTTVQAFRDAGADVFSVQDILDLGAYMTTAVKCGKTTYGIKTGTMKQCSVLLEQELDLFPRVKAFLLMGDLAIRALNVRHVAPPWVPTQQTGATGFKSFHLRKWTVQSGIVRTPSILDNE
ncbi:MAG TPA: hypothetical protein VM075_01755 [Anaerolineae bacterium]|nr:hypothetical protein [Anaerolineae bacterium]